MVADIPFDGQATIFDAFVDMFCYFYFGYGRDHFEDGLFPKPVTTLCKLLGSDLLTENNYLSRCCDQEK